MCRLILLNYTLTSKNRKTKSFAITNCKHTITPPFYLLCCYENLFFSLCCTCCGKTCFTGRVGFTDKLDKFLAHTVDVKSQCHHRWSQVSRSKSDANSRRIDFIHFSHTVTVNWLPFGNSSDIVIHNYGCNYLQFFLYPWVTPIPIRSCRDRFFVTKHHVMSHVSHKLGSLAF